MVNKGGEEGMRLGKYELGHKLGAGNFGEVKHARHVETGQSFAIKILDRKRVQELKIDDQIKREIGTLKMLRHPNVVRLYEVSASKTKIYMVLEYVNAGELFEKIVQAPKRRLSESEGRKLFQQLIDAVSYCHDKGVYHRDLKPENVLIDSHGNAKITDFGLSALPQHLRNDGLLHTTCGSPNYIAPEILQNKGYNGAKSDIWSCGVILYAILTGRLPFDDRNIVVLYQKIFKGEYKIQKCLSSGARNILKRILDPNPSKRIDVAGIKEDEWFKQDYVPVEPNDDDDEYSSTDSLSLSIKEHNEPCEANDKPIHINAFELIGMSMSLDLSGFFEQEDISERKIRFTSTYPADLLFAKIEEIVGEMGFQVQKAHGKLKVMHEDKHSSSPFSVAAEVFELGPSLYIVELRKSYGDSSLYRQLCAKLSEGLGVFKGQALIKAESLESELGSFEGDIPLAPL